MTVLSALGVVALMVMATCLVYLSYGWTALALELQRLATTTRHTVEDADDVVHDVRDVTRVVGGAAGAVSKLATFL